ncbi:MAG: 30S ribosomal protein S20 [Bacteroidetes bacterium]|jgi:small subunit ribosomal protein S20|nr:30S ribosomal protein S20 [Bacteroidota bacterium]MBT6685891.1 30S ribosomal protein S20 [Bacteroidota bacterium]MBT7144045.1 30S ribosomal protein S20 [Bacteroidota bacterium]MBT7490967.1 30S ribosomal protein S20 [Bacteroidota bacterium]
MANHKSALKRIRQNETRRLHNKYYAKTMRNAIRNLRAEKDKKAAEESIQKVVSLIDRVARRNIIHKNKAANLKSGLFKHISNM